MDTHIASGSRVPPFYDSLLGKIIAHGADRAAALRGMRAALAATRIEGVKTNLAFQQAVLEDAQFQQGGVDTGFLARFIEAQPQAPVEKGQWLTSSSSRPRCAMATRACGAPPASTRP